MTAPGLLTEALRVATRFPVFPCGISKIPAIGKGEGGNGFHDATRDPATVTRMFRHPRAALIGVPTGPASGFDVLDIDPRHGGDDWLDLHEAWMPATRSHRTRSGGEHILFRHRPGMRNSESRIAQGVDVRGEGGFIIWWPAAGCDVLCRRPVADWPDWLAELAMPAAPPAQASYSAARGAYDANAAQRIIAAAIARVASASAGQRHYQLRTAAFTCGGLLAASGLSRASVADDLLGAAFQAGGNAVNRGNAAATIESGLDKGAAAPLQPDGRDDGPPADQEAEKAGRQYLARMAFRSLRARDDARLIRERLHRERDRLGLRPGTVDIDRMLLWCVSRHMGDAHAG